MTDEDRRSYSNLILLCYRHHVETNETILYDTAVMHRMKADHESQFKESPYRPNEDAVAAITRETRAYWREVRRRNRESSFPEDIRLEINVEADAAKLFQEVRRELSGLHDLHEQLTHSANTLPEEVSACLERLGYDLRPWNDLPYYENPTIDRNWEERMLGLNNFIQSISVLIDQLELRYLEVVLVVSPQSSEMKAKLNRCRRRMLRYAPQVGRFD